MAVHLWLCHVRDAAALDSSVLSAEEKARARRWQGEGRADIDLGRTLLRHLLSRYSEVAPADWQFEYGRNGKPGLSWPAHGPRFNLSHSGDWLAVVLARDAAVGVDVQVIDTDRPVGKLAQRYFPTPELQDLAAVEGAAYTTHFYRLWALKEALTKARGGALPGALANAAFRLEGDRVLSLTPEATRGACLWLLALKGYALAVCGLSPELTLGAWRWRSGAPPSPLDLPLTASARFS